MSQIIGGPWDGADTPEDWKQFSRPNVEILDVSDTGLTSLPTGRHAIYQRDQCGNYCFERIVTTEELARIEAS